MSVLEQPTIYDEAFYGEPLELPVPSRPLNTDGPLWRVGEWDLVFPDTPVRREPDVQHMISEIRGWTGWSKRQLAAVLGTSHTTVVNAEAGRPLVAARSGDLRRRVASTHDLVRRVFLLAGREPEATARILASPQGDNGAPLDSLQAGDYERAYVAAVDVLRPRQTGMLVSGRPRRPGATTALHD
jgi:hypothetical protein